MGSLSFGAIVFRVYSNDHSPRHVHGFFAQCEVIVDLKPAGYVALADRADAIRPRNAKRAGREKGLESAARHFEELVALWERIHGEA